MGRTSISWIGIELNEVEIDPNEQYIPIISDNQKDAFKSLQEGFPELFHCLFKKVEDTNLQLLIPKTGSLSSVTENEAERILIRFLDTNQGDGNKPITLTREQQFPLEVYTIFSRIICGFDQFDDEFGYLEFIFDDTRGYTVSDGENEYDATLTISEDGVEWDVG